MDGTADLSMAGQRSRSPEAFRLHLHDDERAVPQASMDLLDRDAVESYIASRRDGKPGFSRVSDDQALEMLNITHDGIPTLAAIMNFGIYPQGYFPQLCITAISVPGTEIGDVDS